MKSLILILMALILHLPHAVSSETIQPRIPETCDTLVSYTVDALTSNNNMEVIIYIQTASYVQRRSGNDCHSSFFSEVISGNPSIVNFPLIGSLGGGFDHRRIIIHEPRIPEQFGWNHTKFNEAWKLIAPNQPKEVLDVLRYIESGKSAGWGYEQYKQLLPLVGTQKPAHVFGKLGISTPTK